jgi:ferredoxin
MASINVLLIFKSSIMYKPFIYRLVTDYDIIFNILEAKILPRREGRLILELQGEQEQIEKGLEFLRENKVGVESLADKLWKEEDLCVHCGACAGLCPTGALSMQRPEMEVIFDSSKCVACGMCSMACPFGAMKDLRLFDPFAQERSG